jgi:hypothetical protein
LHSGALPRRSDNVPSSVSVRFGKRDS